MRFLLICLLFISFASRAAISNVELDNYVIKSRAIQQIEHLNSVIHTIAAQRNTDAPLKDVVFIAKASRVDLEVFENEVMNRRYRYLSAPQFFTLLAQDFQLASEFQAPLIFSNYEFSEISLVGGLREMEVYTYLNIAGNFDGAIPFSAPCTITFVIEGEKENLSCRISKLSSGPSIPLGRVDESSSPWDLHTDLFLNPITSPLVSEGYIKYADLSQLIIPIENIQQESEWMRQQVESTGRSIAEICELKTRAEIAAAEVFKCLPYFAPLGSLNRQNSNYFNGDENIRELLLLFDSAPEKIERQAQSVIIDHNDPSDPIYIQAHLVRAWYYIKFNEFSTDFFWTDLEKASYYPSIGEVYLLAFFGNALTEKYSKAIESYADFIQSGSNSFILEFLEETYSDLWFQHGIKMDSYNAHNESMLGYFIGSQFKRDESHLVTLAEKAQKLNFESVALYCRRELMKNEDNALVPDLWLATALTKSKMGMDPSFELEKARALIGGESPLSYCSRAILRHKQGDIEGAQKELYSGIKRFKKSPDLMRTKAELSSDISEKKKAYTKYIKYSGFRKEAGYFKEGFVYHMLADSADDELNRNQMKGYLSDAIYNYEKALKKEFDPALTNKKIAEAYIAMNELEKASYYFDLSIRNQERNVYVYFSQALLHLSSNNMLGFMRNIEVTKSLGFKDVANERDRQLFEFLYTIHDLNLLITLTDDKKLEWGEKKDEQNLMAKGIREQIDILETYDIPRTNAYAGFANVLLESVKGYYERDIDDKKGRYKDKNIRDEGVVDEMLRHSDFELYFFKKNDMLKPLLEWNNEFKDKIYSVIPNIKRNSPLKYLQESRTFKDSYNYL
jgi:hypothetical protein